MNKRHKYSEFFLIFIFLVALIIVYKTVDNFNSIFMFLKKLLGTLSPFVTGFVIAYLLNLPIKKIKKLYEKSKIKWVVKNAQAISIVTVYLAALFLVFIILRMIIPAIYKNMIDLYYNLPFYFERVAETINHWQKNLDISIITIDKESAIKAMKDFLVNIKIDEIGKYAQGVITLTSGIIRIFISLIISIYMVADQQKIKQSIKRVIMLLLSKEKADGLIKYVIRANEIFTKYICSVVIDGGVMGIMSAIAMTILDIRYAVMLGLIIGVSNLIPYFGAIISVIFAIIVTLLTDGAFSAIWVGVILLILQQIDSNLIGPRIMSNMLKARPLLIIFAVTIGGGLFGVWGMILSVPIIILLKIITIDILDAMEEKKTSDKTLNK